MIIALVIVVIALGIIALFATRELNSEKQKEAIPANIENSSRYAKSSLYTGKVTVNSQAAASFYDFVETEITKVNTKLLKVSRPVIKYTRRTDGVTFESADRSSLVVLGGAIEDLRLVHKGTETRIVYRFIIND
jgi:hypothetical protein